MTTNEFRNSLARMDLTQGALGRIFTQLGDTASPLTVRRRVERWAQGGSHIPGEVVAFMTPLKRNPQVLAELRAAVAVVRPVETLAIARAAQLAKRVRVTAAATRPA